MYLRSLAAPQLPHRSDFTADWAHMPRPTPESRRPSGISQACRIQRSIQRLSQAQHLCLEEGTLLEQPSKGRLLCVLLDVQEGCSHEGGHAGCVGVCARACRYILQQIRQAKGPLLCKRQHPGKKELL